MTTIKTMCNIPHVSFIYEVRIIDAKGNDVSGSFLKTTDGATCPTEDEY